MTTSGRLFDTHAHLDDPRFENDLEDVIGRAREAGVERMISIGTNVGTTENAVRIAGGHEGIYASVGLHPHSAAEFSEEHAVRLTEMCSDDNVIAIGEIGLDYYKDRSPREVQRSVFRRMLEIAREVDLPVIVHNRDATDDCLAILKDFRGQIRGVAHCFSGNRAVADRFLDLDFYISFSGTVTFPKTEELAEVARIVPDDRILIETDCPYLAPQAQRGRRNEPAFVKYVAERIAVLRKIDISQAADITMRNAGELFLGKKSR
ncbi:unnamed protein product [marine sediment metagenome]|uniref:Uncharacterized protein n=1 Tax=marine sediment metagenome TaxID=412755 RepID=X0SBR2_9ZZZZ